MKKLLIVDDEQIIRDGLYFAVDWKTIDIHPLSPASCGEEAIELSKRFMPDIAILDISMPDITGLELVKILREHNPDIKCIILSGYGDFSYAQKAIDLKVNKYLLKPTAPEDILCAVKDIISDSENDEAQFKVIENIDNKLMYENNLIINEIIIYLKEFYANKIVIGDIAKRYRISSSHMSSTFKKITGLSISSYLSNIRIEEAKKLLVNSRLRINEVSRRVGIDDELYFSRIFRKATGLSPKQYRQENSK